MKTQSLTSLILSRTGPLRPSAAVNSRGCSAAAMKEFKKDLYNKSQKWNADFKRDVVAWKIEDDFDDWFESLWQVAEHNLVDDPLTGFIMPKAKI